MYIAKNYMISTEHLRAEPYIYRTEPNHHIPARKINRTVPYRGYVRLALDSIEREPNRIDGEMYGTVRFGTDSPLWLFTLDISLSLDCFLTLDYLFTLDCLFMLDSLFTLDCLF